MAQPRKLFFLAGLFLASAFLAGCPAKPALQVNPVSLRFGETETEASFTIENTGGGSLEYRLEEVVRTDTFSAWETQEVSWLSVDQPTGRVVSELLRVTASIDRTGLAAGTYRNTGIRVDAGDAGSFVLPVIFTVKSGLSLSRASFALTPNITESSEVTFQAANVSGADIAWEILYLNDPGDTSSTASLPGGLLVSPSSGVLSPGGSVSVTVSWEAGQGDFYLLFASDQGSKVLSFLFESLLQGFSVTPETLTLYVSPSLEGDQPASSLWISNTGSSTRRWSIEIVAEDEEADTPPFSANPASGSLGPAEEVEVEVNVTDADSVETGAGFYELKITSELEFLLVPLTVENRQLPKIVISEEPQQASSRPGIVELETLEFGKEAIQKTFWIANAGPRTSSLYFEISHEDEGVEKPIISDISPSAGGANGEDGNAEDFFHPDADLSNVLIDGREITVTIDRSNITELEEYRKITVRAVDPDFGTVLTPVEAATIDVHVERPPMTIEGALNRSRPPYVMRFVLLMRDSRGKVIPTVTEADRSRLTFTIAEDDEPIDFNETSRYITGPEDLKVNLALMLDYTGSMYYAGTTDAEDPLEPGEALENVRAAALEFIGDLPDSWRIALMYYSDRQQPDRVIHPFTTDRKALKNALKSFSLPEAMYGVSDIRDALIDGINLIAAEDAGETLPFDDADVRALVFISDGEDNASESNTSEVVSDAQENRVRLYPLGYSSGDSAYTADMLVMANDTGGHYYAAGNVRNLENLLANAKGLDLDETAAAGGAANEAQFIISNASTDTVMNWKAEDWHDYSWIAGVTPSNGYLNPGQSAWVTVAADGAEIGAETTVAGTFPITSNYGDGEVTVQAVTGAGSAVTDVSLTLRDAPGTVWAELQNQIVLTYITPLQASAQYSIRAQYLQFDGATITGNFERDGVYYPGDVRAGQISLVTSGIIEDYTALDPDQRVRAEVYVRTDYVPRNVNLFKMRFFPRLPNDAPQAAVLALEELQAEGLMEVELAPDGLLVSDDPFGATWRKIEMGDGIYSVLTSSDNTLPYGAFGDLLKITIPGLQDFVDAYAALPQEPELLLDMRLDNQIYVLPASPGRPSETVYFLYPSGPLAPARPLSITLQPDLAGPAASTSALQYPGIDPESVFAWDRDKDGLPDFNDPRPDDEDQPGSLIIPDRIEIANGENSVEFTVLNNRLETIEWSLALEPAAPLTDMHLSLAAYDSSEPLAPGERVNITLNADRGTLESGLYYGTLVLETDVFGTEDAPITLVVINE
jgi:hypothetical protein